MATSFARFSQSPGLMASFARRPRHRTGLDGFVRALDGSPGPRSMASFARLVPGGGASVASFARFRSRSHRDLSAILAELGLFRALVSRPVGPAGPIQPEAACVTHV